MSTRHTGLPLLAAALLFSALVVAPLGAKPKELVEAVQAVEEIPAQQLMDVGIRVFDPGLGDRDEEELAEQRIFPAVRKSEARFIPIQLKGTLESTGQWGAVRVIPEDVDPVADVYVSGEILRSSGKDLELRVRAEDATGREWLDRKYEAEADVRAYADDDELVPIEDPFQSLYNRVANDLLAARERLDVNQILTVRTQAQLRFAIEMAPDYFEGYLGTDKRGRPTIQRLPAEDDPMIARVMAVLDTEYTFVDTVNEHYAVFREQMIESYDQWRAYSHAEELAAQKLRRKARTRKILGALLLVGGVVAESNSGSDLEEVLGEAAQVAGVATVASGIAKGREAKLHVETLRELAGSFDGEMEPVLVEVEGQTLRLSGSAEAQYAAWRELLREIFAEETGLPLSLDEDEVAHDGATNDGQPRDESDGSAGSR